MFVNSISQEAFIYKYELFTNCWCYLLVKFPSPRHKKINSIYLIHICMRVFDKKLKWFLADENVYLPVFESSANTCTFSLNTDSVHKRFG